MKKLTPKDLVIGKRIVGYDGEGVERYKGVIKKIYDAEAIIDRDDIGGWSIFFSHNNTRIDPDYGINNRGYLTWEFTTWEKYFEN